MTLPTTLPFAAITVMLESQVTPNTFNAPCGMKERSFTLTKETGETTVPDCDDEAAATWVERDAISRSAAIAGQGVVSRESLPQWRNAYALEGPIRVRVNFAGTNAQGGGFWLGSYHLTNLEYGATKGERCTISVEMQSTGPVVFTPAAP